MCCTQFVADGAELFESIGILPQLVAICEADGVDDEVGVDVLGIAVGGHPHLVSGPGAGSELPGNLMSFLIGDVLSRREGLDILIKVDAIHLAVSRLGRFKLQNGIAPIAVDAADEIPLGLFVPGLVLTHTVIHDGSHGTEVLPGFPNVSYGCHGVPRLIR